MSRYLDMVKEPLHVKKLTPEQLRALAGEIRQELITKLAVNGGHLGASHVLGRVGSDASVDVSEAVVAADGGQPPIDG